MEYILKCGKRAFTGNSLSEVETDYITWANEQDDFIANSYTVIGLCESACGNTRTEVIKSSKELLNEYNYIYITIAERDGVDDDDDFGGTYEASYHLTKETAISAAREILARDNNIVATRVIAHFIGGIDNGNKWDDKFDLLLANFRRTHSTDHLNWED